MEQPIEGSQSFIDAGSVNTAVKARAKRFEQNASNFEGIFECVKLAGTNRKAAAATYKHNVMDSKFRTSKRGRTASSVDSAESSTKVRICGAHVSEQEFVDVLVPNGEVDRNFMWLCNVAIVADWGSKTKHILDQPTTVSSLYSHNIWNTFRFLKLFLCIVPYMAISLYAE